MVQTPENPDEVAQWKRVAERLIDHPSHVKVRHHDWYELAMAYALLAEALPLALDRLQAGGVSMAEQRAFWSAFEGCGRRITNVHQLDLSGARAAAEIKAINRALARFYHWLSDLGWGKDAWRPPGRRRARG